jgi:hypothetical protein
MTELLFLYQMCSIATTTFIPNGHHYALIKCYQLQNLTGNASTYTCYMPCTCFKKNTFVISSPNEHFSNPSDKQYPSSLKELHHYVDTSFIEFLIKCLTTIMISSDVLNQCTKDSMLQVNYST